MTNFIFDPRGLDDEGLSFLVKHHPREQILYQWEFQFSAGETTTTPYERCKEVRIENP